MRYPASAETGTSSLDGGLLSCEGYSTSGALSFSSTTTRTTTWIWVVPLLGGEPPSTAMTLKCTSACSSLSSGFSKTSSTYLSPSLRLPKERLKYSFSGVML
uniref:Uncharacterized protein n=1 Tax=Falco tinnunculus TaxID=100819 RepID=A0A8C4URG0_FALTI